MGQLSDGPNKIVLCLEKHRRHAKEGSKEEMSCTVGTSSVVGGAAVAVRWRRIALLLVLSRHGWLLVSAAHGRQFV